MNNNITHYLDQIDWNILEAKILSHCYLSQTNNNLLTECANNQEIEKKLELTEVFMEIHQNEDGNRLRQNLSFFKQDFDFFRTLNQIKISELVPLGDLNQIILSLEFINNHSHLLSEKYFERIKENNDLIKVVREFRRFISKEGEIDFSKHPLLAHLNEELKQIEMKIRQVLEHLIRDNQFSENLQISQHDVVNDYFVLPIKSDHYQTKFGKIITRSESGRTLFVEPKSIAQHNILRMEIVLKIEKIISRIEAEFIAKIAQSFNDIHNAVQGTLKLDEFLARGSFSFENRYYKPTLSTENSIRLCGAHHPLIPNSIANDIIIDKEKCLVISGPNTGGKTATLKLLALYGALLKRGFYLPAQEACFHPYNNIFFLGNDLQDLEKGLSSFASEIASYQNLVNELKGTNLILIDEIFNSTASEEASALAYSLLKKLKALGDNTIVVSTHHQTLKQYLHNDQEFISAHVGFNTEENKPTYKLIYGSPGSSYALEIFSEMAVGSELFEAVFKNASDYIDTNIVHYEKMLSDLSRKKSELDKLISENRQVNRELKNQKQANESLLNIKIGKKLQAASDEIEIIRSQAEDLLREVRSGEIKNKNKIANKFATIKSKLTPSQTENQDSKEFNYQVPESLVEGNLYYCTQLQSKVELLAINKSKVKILAGKIKVEVPKTSLRLMGNRPQKKKVDVKVHTLVQGLHRKLEYDCRGMRLSEFQILIDQVISDLYMQEVPFANIIHGHGDGILKKWLRDHIKSHPDFQIAVNENGNDGESRIELV